MIEKRKQKSERIHGPARVREDDYDFNDSTLMGSTDSDFKVCKSIFLKRKRKEKEKRLIMLKCSMLFFLFASF